MRKLLVLLVLFGLIAWTLPQKANARENDFKIVLKDGFYGGLVGALVGGAILAFKDEPGDHLDLITKGAAIGLQPGSFGFILTMTVEQGRDHD